MIKGSCVQKKKGEMFDATATSATSGGKTWKGPRYCGEATVLIGLNVSSLIFYPYILL